MLYKKSRRKAHVLRNVAWCIWGERLGSSWGKSRLETMSKSSLLTSLSQFLRARLYLLAHRLARPFLKNEVGEKKLTSLQRGAHSKSNIMAISTFIESVFHMCVTHILFSSLAAFLPSLAALCISHFGTETGNIVVALLGVPLLSTLLTSKAKPLVFVFPLGIEAVKITVKCLAFCENATNVKEL